MKDIGRSGLIFRGAYDPSKQYEILDMVYQDGGCYICTSEAPVNGLMPKEHPEKWGIAARSASLIDREAAQAAAQSAAQDRQAAETAKSDAQAAKDTAVTAKETAVSAKNTAVFKASEASKSATEAAQSAQAARQAADSVDGEALMAAVEGKVSKAGDTMTGALDAPELKEGGTALTDKYAKKSETLPLTGGTLNGDLKIKERNSLLLNAVTEEKEPGGIKFYYSGHEVCRLFSMLDAETAQSMICFERYSPTSDPTVSLVLTNETIRYAFDEIRDEFFPVGKIWQSTDPASPATLIGGTWEAIESGRFLVAAGNGYAVGSKGGAASVSLTAAQNGPHSHMVNWNFTFGPDGSGGYTTVSNGYAPSQISTTSSGSGAPHENRPPYYAVYMWRRIA